LAGAVHTQLANILTLIASDAAVAFWSFFAKEKGLGPRGYERAKHHKGMTPKIPVQFIAGFKEFRNKRFNTK
jgi:hypothetical protein